MDNPEPIDESAVRSAVLVQDSIGTAARQAFQLSYLWTGLCSGAYRLRDHFSSPTRHYIVASWTGSPGPSQTSLTERQLGLLQSLLNGSSQKVLASDMGISVPTVANDLRKALASMGCALPPSRMPLLLTMAAYALSGPGRNFDARCTALNAESQILHVISTERPELRLAGQLSRTELDVIKQFVECSTYREIAAARKASIRTIANQLASAYGRLQVSGRGELLQHIVGVSACDLPASANRRTFL